MNELQKLYDFSGWVQVAQRVAHYYNYDTGKIMGWWKLPQKGLDYKSPHDVVIRDHRERLNELINSVKHKITVPSQD